MDTARTSILVNGFKGTFKFSGRAARSEFWAFAPFGLGVVVLAVLLSSALEFTLPGIVLTAIIASTPLLSLWWRRLQDVGHWGANALIPWFLLFLSGVSFAAAHELHTGALSDLGTGSVVGLLAGLLLYVVGGKWIALFMALTALVYFLVRFSFAFSNALLPSDPHTNKYGPNPHEVPK